MLCSYFVLLTTYFGTLLFCALGYTLLLWLWLCIWVSFVLSHTYSYQIAIDSTIRPKLQCQSTSIFSTLSHKKTLIFCLFIFILALILIFLIHLICPQVGDSMSWRKPFFLSSWSSLHKHPTWTDHVHCSFVYVQSTLFDIFIDYAVFMQHALILNCVDRFPWLGGTSTRIPFDKRVLYTYLNWNLRLM